MTQDTNATSPISARPRRRGRSVGSAALVGLLWLGLQPLVPPASAQPERHETERARAERREPGPRDAAATRPAAEARRPAEADSAEAWTPALYVPPSRGQARRTAAGGTRGSARLGSLELAVIAPRDHVAFTTRAQPKLYWYLSEGVDTRVDVTLIDDESIDPLLELTVPGPVGPGIHEIDLAEHDIVLEPGRVYSWHVALVRDAARRSNDLLAEGFIERTAERDAAPGEARRAVADLARSGLWYDAIARLREAISASPKDPQLRRQQTALLEQAELGRVARDIQ